MESSLTKPFWELINPSENAFAFFFYDSTICSEFLENFLGNFIWDSFWNFSSSFRESEIPLASLLKINSANSLEIPLAILFEIINSFYNSIENSGFLRQFNSKLIRQYLPKFLQFQFLRRFLSGFGNLSHNSSVIFLFQFLLLFHSKFLLHFLLGLSSWLSKSDFLEIH